MGRCGWWCLNRPMGNRFFPNWEELYCFPDREGPNNDMNIVARRTLVAFWAKHPETESSLRAWMVVARQGGWHSMNDVLGTFSKASPINAERCVFDIAGGYRLVVAFKFSSNICFVKFIGTHAEYDRVDVAVVSRFQRDRR